MCTINDVYHTAKNATTKDKGKHDNASGSDFITTKFGAVIVTLLTMFSLYFPTDMDYLMNTY